MKRADYLTDDLCVIKGRQYGQFTKDELIANKYWIVPLRRGYTEIKKLLQLCKKRNAYICGGYARYCASTNKNGIEPSRDIDIFCETEEGFNELCHDIHKLGSSSEGLLEVFETEYAISFFPSKAIFDGTSKPGRYHLDILNNQIRQNLGEVFPIQLIKPIKGKRVTTGDLFDILNNFDMSVCQAAILSEDSVLVSRDFKKKEPEGINVLCNIHNPLMTLKRVAKYEGKNYNTSMESMLKLLKYYNELGKTENESKMNDILNEDMIEFHRRSGLS